MEYGLTFSLFTSDYSIHSIGCKNWANTHRVVRLTEEFNSVDAAKAWATQDESEKADRPAVPVIKVCACTKAKKAGP